MLTDQDKHGIMQMDGHTERMMPLQLQHLILTGGTIAVKMLTMILLQMQHRPIHTLLNHIKITKKTL